MNIIYSKSSSSVIQINRKMRSVFWMFLLMDRCTNEYFTRYVSISYENRQKQNRTNLPSSLKSLLLWYLTHNGNFISCLFLYLLSFLLPGSDSWPYRTKNAVPAFLSDEGCEHVDLRCTSQWAANNVFYDSF
jgi:hypothetical protein